MANFPSIPAQTCRDNYAASNYDAILEEIIHILPCFVATGPNVLPGNTFFSQVIGHPHKKQLSYTLHKLHMALAFIVFICSPILPQS